MDLYKVLLDDLQERKKEYENLKKQEIHDAYMKKLDKTCGDDLWRF